MANTFNREIAKKSEPHRRKLKQMSVNAAKKQAAKAVLLTINRRTLVTLVVS